MEPGPDVEPDWFPSDFLKCSLKSCSYSLDQWVLNYFMLYYLQEGLQNTLECNNKIFTEGMWFQIFADRRGGYHHIPCLSFLLSLNLLKHTWLKKKVWIFCMLITQNCFFSIHLKLFAEKLFSASEDRTPWWDCSEQAVSLSSTSAVSLEHWPTILVLNLLFTGNFSLSSRWCFPLCSVQWVIHIHKRLSQIPPPDIFYNPC